MPTGELIEQQWQESAVIGCLAQAEHDGRHSITDYTHAAYSIHQSAEGPQLWTYAALGET